MEELDSESVQAVDGKDSTSIVEEQKMAEEGAPALSTEDGDDFTHSEPAGPENPEESEVIVLGDEEEEKAGQTGGAEIVEIDGSEVHLSGDDELVEQAEGPYIVESDQEEKAESHKAENDDDYSIDHEDYEDQQDQMEQEDRTDKDAANGDDNDNQVDVEQARILAQLVPVILRTNDSAFLLFPVDVDGRNLDGTIFSDHENCASTIEELFSILRGWFESKDMAYSMDSELVFNFPDLGLVLGEDNVYGREVTLSDILRVFDELRTNSNDSGSSIQIELSEQSRFMSSFNYLSELAREGKGLNDILLEEQTEQAQENHEDQAEDHPELAEQAQDELEDEAEDSAEVDVEVEEDQVEGRFEDQAGDQAQDPVEVNAEAEEVQVEDQFEDQAEQVEDSQSSQSQDQADQVEQTEQIEHFGNPVVGSSLNNTEHAPDAPDKHLPEESALASEPGPEDPDTDSRVDDLSKDNVSQEAKGELDNEMIDELEYDPQDEPISNDDQFEADIEKALNGTDTDTNDLFLSRTATPDAEQKSSLKRSSDSIKPAGVKRVKESTD